MEMTDKAARKLAMSENYTGFCMDFYDKIICDDCPTEKECLALFKKEYFDKTK
jgi:hypothetical protein